MSSEYSLSAETITNGLVTPTVLDALLEAGYDPKFRCFAALSKSAWPTNFVGCESAFGGYVGREIKNDLPALQRSPRFRELRRAGQRTKLLKNSENMAPQ